MTGPWYFCATLTAVCAREVVAPPISSGMSKPWRSISDARFHLVQGRRDRPGEPDDVGALLLGGVQDLLRGHHDAEVDDVVVVALQDDADDVLADVVDVALDRGHDDLADAALGVAGLLLGLDERDQVGDGLLHDAGGLHHLREEHLPGAEQVADDVHAVHQRALDDLDRPAAAVADLARSSSVSSSTNASMPFTSAWVIRSPTGSDRHSSEATSLTEPSPAKSPAISRRRSVLSGRRLRITSSMRSRSSRGTSS